MHELFCYEKTVLTALVVGLCIAAKINAQIPNYVPTNGLQGWWPFNGNANDESGNGLYFVHLLDNQNNTVTVRKIVLN